MDAPTFYMPQLAPNLSQGDILDQVPHVFLRRTPLALVRKTLPQPHGDVLGEVPLATVDASKESGVTIAAQCWVLRAMILSYGCEIDSDRKHRLIALVRPINTARPADELETLRANRNFAFFHLPAIDGVLPECYVDFRRISSVGPDVLESSQRIASLSDNTLRAFHFQLFRFLTRVELDQTVLERIRHLV